MGTQLKTKSNAEKLEELKVAIADKQISHTRVDYFAGEPMHILVYRRNTESPTGCSLLMFIDDNDEANKILTNSLSPLSPTEGKYK